MAQLREIKKRIKAVGNIQRITKTMQMIATAKFQASVRRAQATRPYTNKLREIAGQLSAAAEEVDNPLLAAPSPSPGRELVLVITSNRGLCGAYNANVLRTAIAHLRKTDRKIDLEVIGKKGLGFFRFQSVAVSHGHTQFGDRPTYEQVEQLAAEYIARFERREYDAVRVVYMRFLSNAKQTPEVVTLLPLEPPASEAGAAPAEPRGGVNPVYEFSPDPESLLATLLPLAVKAQLFQAINEAIVSEQIARMVAMKAATDNAGKMVRGLRRTFNRARQAQITTELTEIIGGAAALE